MRGPMIVRQPGRVPAVKISNALQTLVDYAPTFLSSTDIDIPHQMTGIDQSQVWFGQQDTARKHVILENRHEPTIIHLKT